MKPAYYAMALTAVGALCSTGLMFYAARWKISAFLIGIWAWLLLPYAICLVVAIFARSNTKAGLWALIAATVGAAIGVGLPFTAFFVAQPDAQAGLVFLFLPIYQGIASAPFLWLSAKASHRQTNK